MTRIAPCLLSRVTPGTARWSRHVACGVLALAAVLPSGAAMAHATRGPVAAGAFDLAAVAPSDMLADPTAAPDAKQTPPASAADPNGAAAMRAAPTQDGVALGGMLLPAALVDPVIFFQPGRHGPVLELGALGGGNPRAGGLAHVGMDWRF